MKLISGLAIVCAIAASAFTTCASAQQQQQIPAPTLCSIRGGETLLLRLFASITTDCVSTFIGFDGIDILDGPPEITLKFEPGKVSVNTVGGKICKPVAGGSIMITAAKDIDEKKDANLTFRVRYRSKNSNSNTWTYRYHLLIFPASGKPISASKQ
jgi:hypothetical protein